MGGVRGWKVEWGGSEEGDGGWKKSSKKNRRVGVSKDDMGEAAKGFLPFNSDDLLRKSAHTHSRFKHNDIQHESNNQFSIIRV
jgi:hypothetical protein